ncbi:hypothetical protein VMCG_04235 [Cytospora schulzeri]|uniref:Nephrocystin 3-like N-terminal domain-containing protein n=1 Tax=Cytospora schulzeri TaxID=448051 RepID=A0A423WTF3_9PEZI|nr:hypothetical protein VMCG_04235 [Valsa malicola]
MDPLTAIGLVSNILAFIDFSAGLVRSAKEIHDSGHGTFEENRSCETIVREMASLSSRLLPPKEGNHSIRDTPLEKLARECHDISKQLIALLDEIKPKDPDSRSQVLLSALKNKIHEKEREGLEARLGNCRSQLQLQLNFLSSKETLEKLEFLVTASKNDELKLDDLYKQVIQLRRIVELSPMGSVVQSQLKLLLGTEEEIFRTIAKERILGSLEFEGMDRRGNMVVETHSSTYAWVVEDDETIEEASSLDDTGSERSEDSEQNSRQSIDDEKFRAREKLSSWLAAENTSDIFHLSGKLGSGKSTLMKCIIESSRTAEQLHQWAGSQ